jgi:hypothetical protein
LGILVHSKKAGPKQDARCDPRTRIKKLGLPQVTVSEFSEALRYFGVWLNQILLTHFATAMTNLTFSLSSITFLSWRAYC